MPERLTCIEEAEELAVVLAEHQERELPEVRAQLEEALKLQAAIPAIRADAAIGRLTPQRSRPPLSPVSGKGNYLDSLGQISTSTRA